MILEIDIVTGLKFFFYVNYILKYNRKILEDNDLEVHGRSPGNRGETFKTRTLSCIEAYEVTLCPRSLFSATAPV